MKGLGFLIWQLNTIDNYLSPFQLTQLVRDVGIKWISWKISDGVDEYNQVGGNDKKLIEYMQAVELGGAVNGGWSYVYPHEIYFPGQGGAQPGLIAERIQKFSNNLEKFDHVMLDVEAEWKGKGPKYNNSIDKLLYMDISAKFPIGFCSYRYPVTNHSEINYNRFFKNATVNFTAPQVYWIGSHDPETQLVKCFNEYQTISLGKSDGAEFVPIGATFGAGTWLPTTDDLKKFMDTCKAKSWPNYGFYSLDWILTKNRYDWLSTIAGHVVNPPGEPPVQTPTKIRIKVAGANVRNAPNLTVGSDIGDLIKGAIVDVIGENEQFYTGKVYVAKTVADPVQE